MFVEGNDGIAAAGDSDFQNHIVAWVFQEGAPNKEYLVCNRHLADVVENGIDVALGDRQVIEIAHCDALVLQDERHGDVNIENAST